MQPTTEKVVDINKYRRRLRENQTPVLPPHLNESAVKEIAYHLLIALQRAKQLL